MTGEFQWTASDYFSAQRAKLMQHPWLIVRRFWYAVAIVFMAVVANLVIVWEHPSEWTSSLIIVLLFVLVWFPPGLLAMWWRWHRDFKLGFPTEAGVSATLDGQGVKLGTKGAEKRTHWVGFSLIYESNRVVVFEKGDDEFLFIPKKQMSPEQLGELRDLVNSNARCKVELTAQQT